MKPAIKFLKWIILPIIILLFISCAAFYLFGEHILKTGIEKAATEALGVVVNIDDVDISIFEGAVGITGLIVRNPPGYAHDNLLELTTGRITASIGSLLDDTVRINQIKLDGINLVIEQKALSNNLHDILKSLRPAKKQQPEPTGKKLHIDELEITNITVKVKPLPIPIPGALGTIPLKLRTIGMSNLGADNKLSTELLTSKILLAIASSLADQGAGILPDEILNTVKSTLDRTLGLSRDVLKEGEKLMDTGKDLGSEIIKGLENLLKPTETDN